MPSLYQPLLIAIFLLAPLIFVLLLFVDAPYGHSNRPGWGPQIAARPGWVLMELPAVLCFVYFYSGGLNSGTAPALILLGLWLLHYLHRSFIYPFTLPAHAPGMAWLIVLFGGGFNAINGYLQGSYIGHLAPHLALPNATHWLADPRFIGGIALFAFGFILNKHSDALLRRLALAHPNGPMQIPYGGGFRWVSQPNYLGEILTWLGFALAAWSPAGLAFALFSFANLGPRALRKHRWYKTEFAHYPKGRKAILPGVL